MKELSAERLFRTYRRHEQGDELVVDLRVAGVVVAILVLVGEGLELDIIGVVGSDAGEVGSRTGGAPELEVGSNVVHDVGVKVRAGTMAS